ncbi:hypothetical protein [Streptomyces sp. NBC_01431]|uniref:SLAC1 family transporter n=1 Tax=Streptomyces sp. NBC_01431 TaxID=2903863 RepID=UPI003FCD7252
MRLMNGPYGWLLQLISVVLYKYHAGQTTSSVAAPVGARCDGAMTRQAAPWWTEGGWLARAALVALVVGLILYVQALGHFDFRQLRAGAGDQWIGGGALAISALAASRLALSPVWTGAAHTALGTTTLVLLGLSLAWCAVLLAAETRWPRPGYDIRRWSTVFPVGMTAVAALSTAAATEIDWLHTLGQVLLWIAVVMWLLTLIGFLHDIGTR